MENTEIINKLIQDNHITNYKDQCKFFEEIEQIKIKDNKSDFYSGYYSASSWFHAGNYEAIFSDVRDYLCEKHERTEFGLWNGVGKSCVMRCKIHNTFFHQNKFQFKTSEGCPVCSFLSGKKLPQIINLEKKINLKERLEHEQNLVVPPIESWPKQDWNSQGCIKLSCKNCGTEFSIKLRLLATVLLTSSSLL